MAVKQYIGARYVPIFKGLWDGSNDNEHTNTKAYEPLVIVLNEGASYTSMTYVPVGIDITNTSYWALTGNYNAQVESYRQEVEILDNNLNDLSESVNNAVTFYSPKEFGAVLDGVADDTNAMNQALALGSVMLPKGVSIKINNLYVPDFAEIDFNGCDVYTDGWAIKTEATAEHGYIRNITIRNAHFKTPNILGAPLHSCGGIYIEGGIKINIVNCELANSTEGSDFAHIRNSFNVYFDKIAVGTGISSGRIDNTSGIVFYCGSAVISGSDNITNCSISNVIIQNLEYGILVEANDKLFDTAFFDNIGFSNVSEGVYLNGDSTSTIRNCSINSMRCELSDRAIYNTGHIILKGFYGYHITDEFINNSGFMTVLGDIGANNLTITSAPLYKNTGVINASASYPELLANVTIDNTGDIVNPYIPNTADTNDFCDNTKDKSIETFTLTGSILLTGTSGASGGQVAIAYPSGYNRDNSIIINKSLYRSNLVRVGNDAIIDVSLSPTEILVDTSTGDSTTFSRPFEIVLIKKDNLPTV